MDAQASDAEVDRLTPENAAQERRLANLAKGRSLATHRPDCGCRICTKRRRVAAQAQGIIKQPNTTQQEASLGAAAAGGPPHRGPGS
jgi:hypothetical protein